MVVGDKRWLEAFRRRFHRAQVNIGAMELSDAEMDVDSSDDMSSNDMDIDSDLSLASPPPEAHDGSDCSSSMDWNDTEPPRGMNRDMSLSASSEEEGQDESATEPQTQDRDLRALSALKVRVREAMSVAHWGEPDTAFERQMARLQLHGLDLGTKYRSHHLVQSVERLAAVAARARTANALDRNLASLGIPSDLNLIFDGVRIGATSFSRHETLNVIGFSWMGVFLEGCGRVGLGGGAVALLSNRAS